MLGAGVDRIDPTALELEVTGSVDSVSPLTGSSLVASLITIDGSDVSDDPLENPVIVAPHWCYVQSTNASQIECRVEETGTDEVTSQRASVTRFTNEFFDGDKTSVLKGMSTRFGSVHHLSTKYLEAICEDRTQEFDLKSLVESESEDLKLQLPLMLSRSPQSIDELPFSIRVVIDKLIPLMVAMAKLPQLMALIFIVVKAMMLLLTLMVAIANKSRARNDVIYLLMCW